MKGVIGLVLNMGLDKRSDLKDYWSTIDSDDMPFYRSVLSRDRFFQIFGMLHVGESDGEKKEKIQPLMDKLLPLYRRYYIPHQAIAVDESVISFKGRVGFRQYLKGKPHPWGIKAFVLSDSTNGYLYNVCIYYGKNTELVRPDLPHTVRVVLTMTEGLEQKGYDLYIDRFYSSPLLAEELTAQGITITGVQYIKYLYYIVRLVIQKYSVIQTT